MKVTDRYYTIGMAGHIDHGKTELTKALTEVETDRLKEEKERHISIELGYAPFRLREDMQVSIIDVPGHEKFIRQMIAGVAGIDLVIIVIAADEGVMPQTKEHLEILSFLGIEQAVIAITKIDRVDDEWLELVREDVTETIVGTPFESAEMRFVDSLSKKGIPELTKMIEVKLKAIPAKSATGPFRLPIDQVFTIQGQGTVVRGTVFEGSVQSSDLLKVLPQNKEVRVRQLQVQNEKVKTARAGQRAALNLGGISKDDIRRGDVLVSSNHYLTTKRIDVSLHTVRDLDMPLKQRAPVNVHIGTAIVMGKIIVFDRNRLESGQHVLCQLELEEPVVVKRGERLIIRRPTPVETIGGGWVIDAQAEKHRFGEKTIEQLQRKKEGTPEDRIVDVLRRELVLSEQGLLQQTGMHQNRLDEALQTLEHAGQIRNISGGLLVLTDTFNGRKDSIIEQLNRYHDRYPLRPGMDKAEIVQSSSASPELMEAVIASLKEAGEIKQHDQYLALHDFVPSLPGQWRDVMDETIAALKAQQLQVQPWDELVQKQNIPEHLQEDFKHYLLQQGYAYKLDNNRLLHTDVFLKTVNELYRETEGDTFALQQAKDVLGLSRKYLIPFMELLDRLKLTVRDGSERKWVKRTVDEYLA